MSHSISRKWEKHQPIKYARPTCHFQAKTPKERKVGSRPADEYNISSYKALPRIIPAF